MQTQEAWASNRPIYSRLPEIYKENKVADCLTIHFDELLTETKAKVDDIPRQLNPQTCDPIWLDFLAPLCGFTGEYWDRGWTTLAKRRLLTYSYQYIWSNKGSQDTLSLVLNCFSIRHVILSEGDFILGTSQVGDILGSTPWEYTIYLPTAYIGNYKVKLTEKLNRLFGPCWCKSQIKFEDKYFKDLTVIGMSEDTVLGTEDNNIIGI
ncbi:phage tail protein [Nostoc sp. UHCC 0870]|uniref:phage tail protein n=1 Tax=Nostoc sp. UHCC 0870 TaxID=2914041 RepID=UPI001EDD11E0|nr:phage tail protein [Nostoc sp. UHCC 0870]UKO99354.1 phage tail protein [Nostoc sp. UHCC 0870]